MVCDECRAPATTSIFLATGHVYIDGKEKGQDADFCDAHRPITKPGEFAQPNNCTHVQFGWPNIYPEK